MTTAESITWTIEIDLYKLDQSTLLKDQNAQERYSKTGSINLSDSSSLTYIDSNTFVGFTILTKVIMDRNRVYNFPSDKPFLIHNKIDTYHCTGCAITRIYNRTFLELPELSMLVLSENKIDFVSPFAFYKNSKLNYLDLQSNRLKHFNDQGYLHQMHNIGYLFLSGNNEFNFRNGRSITGRSDTLKVFKCDGCAIEDACVIFRSYSKIFELQLTKNHLTSFDCVEPKHAKEINLSGNPIKHLTVSGKKLEHFYCSGCSVEAIDAETFKDAPILKAVDLSSNAVQTITANAFRNTAMLEDLKLDSNRIGNFSQEFLESLPNLRNLCVDDNNFCPSYDNTLFKKMYIKRRLRSTCVSNQPFEKSLPDIKSRTGKVLCERKTTLTRSLVFSTLDLSNQDIAFLASDYLGNSEDIKILNVSHNSQLTFHEEGPFLNHSFLEELIMSHCGVEQIFKETFVALPKLMKIDLSNNRIKMIADYSFSQNGELEDLILDGNAIGFLTPGALKSTGKLSRLSMSSNEEFDFEENEIFLEHPGLQEFLCDNCGIRAISTETFSQMTNLRKVVLRFNKIDDVEANAFDENKHLKYLNLDGNELVSFDVNLVNGLTELKTLCLDKNEKFDFSNTKANLALRQFYVTKNLRSASCDAENEDEYVENRLPKPTMAKTAVFHPKALSKSMQLAEPEQKDSKEQDDEEIDTEYEDTSLQLDQENDSTSKTSSEFGEDTMVVKKGSFGGGNSGSRLTGCGFGILMTSLYVIIVYVLNASY